jgi:O-antigen/teichoic acid export membrane protein
MTMPNLRFRRLRPYLGLGAAFQAGWVIEVVRYNVLAAGVASIGGLSLLGLMSLAERLIQPVQLVVENLARVAFPAFSRTASTDRAIDGDLLLRTTRLVAVPIWFALTIVVSASLGLMTLLLGEQWADAVDLLPFFCFRIGLTAPIIVVFTMYLYSVGQGRLVVSLGALGGVVNVAVSLAGAATLGATGIGLGFVASALVELAIVEPLFRRRLGRSTLGSFLAPVAVGLAAVAAAVGTQEALGAGWAASVAAVAVGAAVFAALVAAFLRPVVLEVRRLLVRR